MPKSHSIVSVLALVVIGACGSDVTDVENPLPTVSGLAPDTVLVGDSLVLLVTGTGFVEQSTIQLRGAGLATTLLSASELRATLRPIDLPLAESAPVTVFTPEPGGGLSSPVTLVVANPPPTLTALSPDTAGVGGSAFPITLSGSGFNLSSRVLWNGAERSTELLAGDRLRIQLDGAELDSSGVFPVSVLNPPPGGGASESRTFTMFNPGINLTRVEPDTVLVGSGPVAVTVYGQGFRPGAQVLVRNTYLSTIATDTSLSATVPDDLFLLPGAWGKVAGTLGISAVNPPPDRGPAVPVTLTIANPVPVLDSITPDTVTASPLHVPGVPQFRAYGSGFVGYYEEGGLYSDTRMLVNGVSGPAYILGLGPTQMIFFVFPAWLVAGDTLFIAMQNPAPGGGVSTTIPIEVRNPVPVVTGFTPAGAPVGAPNTTVTADGSGFTTASWISLDGTPLATTFVSASQLTAVVPAEALASPGVRTLAVTSPAPGGGASAPFAFMVQAAPPSARLRRP